MSTLSIYLFLGFLSVCFRHLNLLPPVNSLIITVLLYTGIYKVLLKTYVQCDIDLGPDYLSRVGSVRRAASVCRDDFLPGII